MLLFASCGSDNAAEELLAEKYEYTANELSIDEPLWLDRFTREEVWHMVENTDDMIQRVLGVPVDLHGPDSILIGRRYLMASGTANIPIGDRIITQETDIFFLPTTVDNNISLWLVAYDIAVHTGLVMNGLTTHFNPESFFNSDEDTITVRFTRAYDDGRPVFYYVEEEFSRDVTIDEINKLMRSHTGQQVMDIWFCRDVCSLWRWDYGDSLDASSCPNPNKLYINIYPVDFVFFDWGSTGSYMRGRQLLDTFFSFPGVEYIEVLVNSNPGGATSHFSFNQVFHRNWATSSEIIGY